jgi:hypothetical protein
MRKLAQPHMLFHVLLAGVGVVLLVTGSAAGLYLLICAVMMGVMMTAMGGHGDDRSDGDQGHH